MQHHDRVRVKLWGEVVGYLAELENGSIAFEYDSKFKAEKLEIAPFEMPLATTTVYQSKERSSTFQGLPGAIADCLPDSYGKSIIASFYKKYYGWESHTLNVLDYLCYLSDRSIGALEFEPSTPAMTDGEADVELEILLESARKTLEGKADEVTSDIIRMSASAGGRQAKAVIDYNPSTQEIRTGFADAKTGFIPCIIKLDGLRDGEEPNFYGRLEYIYAKMAQDCGIEVPKVFLLESDHDHGPAAHFLVERFDRNSSKEKIVHYASLCGLSLHDFREKHSCSYETFFSIVQHLTSDASQVEQALQRAIFNIIFRNQDDHTKNFGFVMNRKGEWRLSLAFDLNYVFGPGGVKKA